MNDVMKIVILRNQDSGDTVDLLLVMNYDESFDAVARRAIGKYYTPDGIGARACDSIDLTEFVIDKAAEAGYSCAVAPWTRIDV